MRELYASPNGDRWHLLIDEVTGHVFVHHTANEPSGGNVVDMAMPVFLSLGRGGPEHEALWALLRAIAQRTFGDSRGDVAAYEVTTGADIETGALFCAVAT